MATGPISFVGGVGGIGPQRIGSGKSIPKEITRYLSQLESTSSSNYQLDTPFNPRGSFEISMDFMVTSTTTQQWLYSRWGGTSVSVALRVSGGSVDFFVSFDGTNAESHSIPVTGSNIWHHVVIVLLTRNSFIIALDGVVTSIATGTPSAFSGSEESYIGSRDGSSNFVNGLIKNVRLKDLEVPANNQSYNLDSPTGNTEISTEGGNSLSYINVPDSQREPYQLDSGDVWNNISPMSPLLPLSISTTTTDIVSRDLILLIGQSNMKGAYGPIDPMLDATDPNIYQYGVAGAAATIAEDPLLHWSQTANNTIGLGLTLGKEYNVPAGREVLLIPAAKGGTGFSDGFWTSTGDGYERVTLRAYEAMLMGDQGSRIAMIAWHQGEDDRLMTEAQYAAELDILITNLRLLIPGASSAPFIVGEVSPSSTEYGAGVAAALLDTPNRHLKAGYVSTSDLSLGPDVLHFTAASLRTMGERYNAVYETL